MKPLTSLQEKKRRQEDHETQIALAFAYFKEKREPELRKAAHKKKPAHELLETIRIKEGLHPIRDPKTYVPKSYNVDKQRNGLIAHMYAKYPVPVFMYQAFNKTTHNRGYSPGVFDLFQDWYITMAQGGSFRKATKGIMTHKEAFVFLSAPNDQLIHENVWWAKMKVAGLPSGVIHRLLEKVFTDIRVDDPNSRYTEIIHFFANNHTQMDKITFGEITDFLVWKLRNEPTFSMKGRTVASVVALVNEWQLLMQKAKLGKNVEWEGKGAADWEYVDQNFIWVVKELRNNRELADEGKKQKHCVYSYVKSCAEGRSFIFSLRAYFKAPIGENEYAQGSEATRVTIEVNSNDSIIQVRGNLNRIPTKPENEVIRRWAGEKGYRNRSY